MRATIFKSAIPLVLMLLISSCSLFDFDFPIDPPNPPDPVDTTSTPDIVNIVQAGEWQITYFNDSGNNETAHFSGFSFSFNDDGSLAATSGMVTHTGLWNITDDHGNSNDDDDNHHSDDIDFNIDFNSPDHFEELSEDWDIISITDTRIELIHISGGNGGIDYLTFERL